MALHLIQADPSLADDLLVIDPSGEWLQTWDEQFGRLEIDVLRSPGVHHPDPDVDALSTFITANGHMSSGLPYDPPITSAFRAFNRQVIGTAGLRAPIAVQPRRVGPESDGRLRLETTHGSVLTERLVIATNPHRRQIPDWVWPRCGRARAELAHAADVDLRRLGDLGGQRVVVVGGGLTASHLAVGAARRNAEVELVSRRPLQIRAFDTDPGWLGPKHLRGFEAVHDLGERLEMARSARGGGTIPAWMRSRLDHERITCRESVEVLDVAGPTERHLVRLGDGSSIDADRIWLATGTQPDLAALRCLEPLLPDIAIIDGVPVPDETLRIGLPPIHVMGRLAVLQLGPAAGNLWGARHAARRITEAITGIDTGAMSNLPRRRRV